MSHRCHYPGCTTATPPRLLFCASHWAMVPRAQQDGVWAAYKGTTRGTRMTSIPYMTACAEAVEAVAAKLGVIGAEYNSYRRVIKTLGELAALRADRAAKQSAEGKENG